MLSVEGECVRKPVLCVRERTDKTKKNSNCNNISSSSCRLWSVEVALWSGGSVGVCLRVHGHPNIFVHHVLRYTSHPHKLFDQKLCDAINFETQCSSFSLDIVLSIVGTSSRLQRGRTRPAEPKSLLFAFCFPVVLRCGASCNWESTDTATVTATTLAVQERDRVASGDAVSGELFISRADNWPRETNIHAC